MKAPFSRIPAVPVAIMFAVGIVGCCESNGSLLVPLAFVVGAAIALIFKRQYLGVVAFAAAVGWFAASVHKPAEAPDDIVGKKIFVCGVVQDKNEGGSYTHLGMKIIATSSKTDGKVTFKPIERAVLCDVLVHTSVVAAMPGDTVVFKTELQRIESKPDLPLTFDYNARKRLSGLTVSAAFYSGDIPVTGRCLGFKHILNETRNAIFDGIVKSPISPQSASFLVAMLLGDKSFLEPELKRDFRTSGLAHMLAISGLHVGVIVWLFSVMMIPLRRMRGGRVRFAITILFVWIYALIVGLPASVVRAAVMITVYFLARMMQRGVSGFNSLALAVLAILLFDPYSLYMPGFQLSVAAVASILWFAPRIVPTNLHGGLRFVADALVIPISAMLGTSLISVVWFHQFPVAFIFSNMVACAVLPVLMLFAVITVGCMLLGMEATFCGSVVDFLYGVVENVAQAFSCPPFTDIQGIWLSTPAIIAGIFAVVVLALALEMKRRAMIPVVACSIVLFFIAASNPERAEASGEVWLLASRGSTDMLVRDGNSAVVYTTAREADFPAISAGWRSRYENYLGYYACPDTINVVGNEFKFGRYAAKNRYMAANGKIIAVVDNDTMRIDPRLKADYVVVCKGFKGDVVGLASLTQADTVVLSGDLNRRRSKRYFRECEQNGIPVLDMREMAPYRIGN